ncbi:MAG: response regulator, partial [Candidatus Marinimicrobia bacterium]|nr:response regulator [Candidatus Neomarinimicrobiota bacterium]
MSKVKVLVVEDNTDVAEGIRDILEDKGYSVTDVIDSGEEAIKKAGETCPDLVLMDIVLKGHVNGIEAAKQIHVSFNIPVIYLTGYADEKKLQQAKLTEPYGYILKPFNAQELHATIEMAIYKRKLENELKSRFSTVLRSIGDAVITIDKKGFITFMNPVAEALTGWKKEVAQGKALTEVFDVKDKDKIISIKSSSIKSLFKGDIDNISCDSMLINKEKTDIPVEFNIAPIRDDKEIITGFVLLFHDITERLSAEQAGKKAEDALQIERNNLRNIINSMEDGVYIVNRRYD